MPKHTEAGLPSVALVGAPNVGKSTLFNTLTGARRQMGNWPGTTVEVGTGVWQTGAEERPRLAVADLPGAYSLDPVSPDEELTRQLLLEVDRGERPDVVVVTADAAHLERSLYLVAQVREHDYRAVVALTMSDIASRRGLAVDVDHLARALGVPVVPVDPRRGRGAEDLATAIHQVLEGPVPAPRTSASGPLPSDADDLDRADERFAWVAQAVERAANGAEDRVTLSDRIDAVVTSPWFGPPVFLAAMWLVFQITTVVAAPLQDGLDQLFVGPVSDGAVAALERVHWDGTPVEGFVVDGLIAGVGMLLTFAPLMALMFLLLALLEDSGYMARAAVVTDRLMRAIGLPGRAFLPLIVGFGCNVPAISATRTLPNARNRLMTALLVPLTSCSARLTVYVLLAHTFFPDHTGTVVFAMYVTSILLVILFGLALRATLWRTMGSDPLVLDLPPYQVPSPRLMLDQTWTRLRAFLQTAGGIIVATVVVVWALQATPTTSGHAFGDVPVEDSAYASASKVVAPVFEPAGFGDWRTSSGLVVGFVAKEAVISSWAQTYAVSEPESEDQPGHLGEAIKADLEKSSGGHADAAALAFMIFLLAYTPCVATLAAQVREIGKRWTAFGVVAQMAMAWGLAVLTFQVLRIWL